MLQVTPLILKSVPCLWYLQDRRERCGKRFLTTTTPICARAVEAKELKLLEESMQFCEEHPQINAEFKFIV